MIIYGKRSREVLLYFLSLWKFKMFLSLVEGFSALLFGGLFFISVAKNIEVWAADMIY